MSDETTKITWVDACRNVVEHEIPAGVAERIAAGETVNWYGAEPTRRPIDEVLKEIGHERAGLMARRDQINAELDDLVDAHPDLKSAPRSRPPDEAA
jgi:hypothetical protein